MKEMNRFLFDYGQKTIDTINSIYNTMQNGCVEIVEGSVLDDKLSSLWGSALDVMVEGLGIEDGDWKEEVRNISGIAVTCKELQIGGFVISDDDLYEKLSGDEAEEIWKRVKEARDSV